MRNTTDSSPASSDTKAHTEANAHAQLPHGALSGLKVIDASRVLGGPICGQMLGDHGAEVIKVEAPAGDDTRSWGPPDLGPVSAYFSGANRNKRVLVLD